jgi:hypothetical protein
MPPQPASNRNQDIGKSTDKPSIAASMPVLTGSRGHTEAFFYPWPSAGCDQANSLFFDAIYRFPRPQSGRIDALKGLPYKPAKLTALITRRKTGSYTSLRHPRAAESGEITREADLSSEQAGAQAPSRFPQPHVDQRGPQGRSRQTRTRPQAPQRLSRAREPASFHGAIEATCGFPGRRDRREGTCERIRAASSQAA